jgi:hypothetical protein
VRFVESAGEQAQQRFGWASEDTVDVRRCVAEAYGVAEDETEDETEDAVRVGSSTRRVLWVPPRASGLPRNPTMKLSGPVSCSSAASAS